MVRVQPNLNVLHVSDERPLKVSYIHGTHLQRHGFCSSTASSRPLGVIFRLTSPFRILYAFIAFSFKSHTVCDLKEKAIKVSQNDFVAIWAHVWKTKGTMVIDNETSLERLEEILRSINVDDKETIERVRECAKVTSLGLSNGQILTMQVPGTSSCTLPLAAFSYWA
jgi:hypothetical protein